MPKKLPQKPPKGPGYRWLAVAAPIGFLVFALNKVESFIRGMSQHEGLTADQRMYCVYLGVGAILFLTLIVSAFGWWKPRNLLFDQDAYLENKNPD